MDNKKTIETIIYDAIDDLNHLIENPLKKSMTTRLYGDGSSLSSIDLVDLVIQVEERVNETFDTLISLTDDKALSEERSPFRNVTSLQEYLLKQLEKLPV